MVEAATSDTRRRELAARHHALRCLSIRTFQPHEIVVVFVQLKHISRKYARLTFIGILQPDFCHHAGKQSRILRLNTDIHLIRP